MPLEALTDHGNRMQRLNFEPVEAVASDITEIRHLSATLERMRAALCVGMEEGPDLRKLAARLDGFVRADLPKVGPLSVWLLQVNGSAKRVTVLGLGEEALLCRLGLNNERVAAAGGPLGFGPIHELTQTVELNLADKDTVLLVSDGVLDALDEQRHRYGFAGLERALRKLDGGTA